MEHRVDLARRNRVNFHRKVYLGVRVCRLSLEAAAGVFYDRRGAVDPELQLARPSTHVLLGCRCEYATANGVWIRWICKLADFRPVLFTSTLSNMSSTIRGWPL